MSIQGVFIDEDHKLTVAFGDVAAHIAMAPEEMRAFAAELWLHAREMEQEAGDAAEAALARAVLQ